MYKKNYLTNEEQYVWSYIKDKEIIDNNLLKEIFPEMKANRRNIILHNLYKKNFLKRARKDLYYNNLKLTEYYKLALNIKDGYIGLSSALKYYNLIDYEDFTIFIMTKNYQKNIIIKGTKYDIKYIPLKNFFTGFQKINNFYISSIEKTIIDCFLKIGYVDLSITTKAIYNSNIKWNIFIELLKIIKNNSLHQRIGYILNLMKENTNLNVPDFVLNYLEKNVKNPVKLLPINNKSVFNKKWKMQDNLGEKNILEWWY